MNEKLISWIKEVHPDPDEDFIKNRNAAIESWIGNFGNKDICFLVSTILGKEQENSKLMQVFADKIKEHDDMFVPNDSKREIEILAAVTFEMLIEYDDADSVKLALAYLTASLGRSLRDIPRQNILGISKNYLEQHVEDEKTVIDDDVKSGSYKDKIAKIREDLTANPNLPPSSFLETVLSLIETSAKGIRSGHKVINKLKAANSKLSEEIDVLWWAFSGVSNLLDKPYSKMSHLEACMLMGYELSNAIKITPGPVSTESILEKQFSRCSGHNDSSTSLEKAITSMNDELITITKSNLDKVQNLEFLFPFHEGIKRYDYTGRTGNWFSAYCTSCDIQGVADLSFVQIAKQFSYECQLIDILKS